MTKLNLDASKDVVADVGSNGKEIELTFDIITNKG